MTIITADKSEEFKATENRENLKKIVKSSNLHHRIPKNCDRKL